MRPGAFPHIVRFAMRNTLSDTQYPTVLIIALAGVGSMLPLLLLPLPSQWHSLRARRPATTMMERFLLTMLVEMALARHSPKLGHGIFSSLIPVSRSTGHE